MPRTHCCRHASALWFVLLIGLPAAATASPAASTPAPAKPSTTAAKPPPPPPPPSAAQLTLDDARELLAKRKYEKALRKLDEAADADGAAAIRDQIRVTKAEALLAKRHPDADGARAIILQVLHDDPDGRIFNGSSDDVNAIVNDLRDSHPLVLHIAHPFARAGRPLRLRARVQDPKGVVTGVTLFFRGHDMGDYSDAEMTRQGDEWEFLLRDPETLAPAGVTDDYGIDYYLSAKDSSGQVVDTDGSADEPLTTTISTRQAEAAETAAGVDLNAVIAAENRPPPVVVVPHVTPWYLQWYTIVPAAVVVVAAIVIPTAVVLTRPTAKLPENLGVVKFPVMP